MQRIPEVTREDVARVVRRELPSEVSGNGSRPPGRIWKRIVARSGSRQRVQLAILKLAGGDLDRLLDCIQTAMGDFRDVLAAAEYSRYVKESWARLIRKAEAMSPQEAERTMEEDWNEYQAWLCRE